MTRELYMTGNEARSLLYYLFSFHSVMEKLNIIDFVTVSIIVKRSALSILKI